MAAPRGGTRPAVRGVEGRVTSPGDGRGGGSAEADPADAFLEAFGAGDDLDLDAHEVDGDVAAIELGEPDGVLLRGDEHGGAALLGPVDGVQDLLLVEAMVVGEAPGEDDLGSEFDELGFEALGLGDAAQGGNLPALEEVESVAVVPEDILEVERVMDALDDVGGRVELGDADAEFIDAGGVRRRGTVNLVEEDHVGAPEVRRGFAQGAAGKHVPVREGLL